MIRCHQVLGTRADATEAEVHARLKRVRVLLHPDRHSSLSAGDLEVLRDIVSAAEGAAETFTAEQCDDRGARLRSVIAQMRMCTSTASDDRAGGGGAVYECRVRVGPSGDKVERVICTLDGRKIDFAEWLPVHEACLSVFQEAAAAQQS